MSRTSLRQQFKLCTYICGNYSREETIQGRKLFAEIRYVQKKLYYVLSKMESDFEIFLPNKCPDNKSWVNLFLFRKYSFHYIHIDKYGKVY